MKNIFAHQIGKLRTERHLSQTDVAKRLYVSRQAVSKWENGDAEPSLDNLITLAKLFNVSLDNLITGQYDPTTTLLKISHLKKAFTRPVLRDINFSIYDHDRVALLGSNGAGKSTLIKIMIGLLRPDTGTIKSNINPHRDLGIMPQENVLIPELTVYEQVKLTALINHVYQQERIGRLLGQFNLADHAKQVISKLSGGQKRRLSLLLCTLRPVKLLILDEPTVGMDLTSIDFFWDLLDRRGGSTIVVTHDFNQIDKYFTRVLLLKDGVIAQDVPVKMIHSHNQTIAQWYRTVNKEA